MSQIQLQQRKILLVSVISATLLSINFLTFFFMVPLIYVYYRYGTAFFKRALLYAFSFSIFFLIISEALYSFTQDSNSQEIVKTDPHFFIQFLFIASWFIMLFLFAATHKVVWQIRLPLNSMIVFIAMIPMLSYVESTVQNTAILSELARILETDGEQLKILYQKIFMLYKYNLCWLSMFFWFLCNWFIAISILSCRYSSHPSKYYDYLFEKIKRDFIARKFLALTILLFFAQNFLFSTWEGSENILVNTFVLFSGNLLSVLLFLYVIRGIVVFHTLVMYRLFLQKDIYLIVICTILLIPILGAVLLYVLFFSGVLQDLLGIERIRGRKKERQEN